MRRIVLALTALLWAASAEIPANAGSLTLLGVGGPAAGGGLVLDGVANVKVAYSYSRKLLTSYAGNAMTIQETTGHTTTTVGFTGSPPVLNQSTITTFCSGKTCVVKTLNDQSGGGNDCTQTTEAIMPIIFTGGAIQTLNSQPAGLFNGSGQFCDNLTLSANPTSTLWQDAVVITSSATAQAITGPTGTTASLEWRINASLNQELLKSFVASLATSSSALTAGTAAIVEGQTDGINNYSFWINGTAAGSGTLTGAPVSLSAGTFEFGAQRGGTGDVFTGKIAEYIAIDGSGTPASRGTIQANQKAFYGTP